MHLSRNKNAWIAGGLVLLCVNLVLGFYVFDEWFNNRLLILRVSRPVSVGQEWLTEAEVLEVGQAALKVAGYSDQEWRPQEEERDAVTGERFVSRNSLRPQDATIAFRQDSNDGFRYIFFSMRRQEDRYEVTLSHGK